MANKDRIKAVRKKTDSYEEESRHAYKATKERESKKAERALQRALKSKDYTRLANIDDIY